MEKIAINDIGTDLRVTVKEDDVIVNISTATELKVIVEKPSGIEVEFTASLFTDGTDGILHYVTIAKFDEIGIYTYRGKVTFSASMVFYTIDPEQFEIVA